MLSVEEIKRTNNISWRTLVETLKPTETSGNYNNNKKKNEQSVYQLQKFLNGNGRNYYNGTIKCDILYAGKWKIQDSPLSCSSALFVSFLNPVN